MTQYQDAEANRGTATDGDELAGVDCALAVLNKQKAQTATGQQKDDYMAASSGYWSDAHELSPDLKRAMGYLREAGLSTRIQDYLPSQLQDLMNNPLQSVTDKMNIHLPF
jgi:hypothetical protein